MVIEPGCSKAGSPFFRGSVAAFDTLVGSGGVKVRSQVHSPKIAASFIGCSAYNLQYARIVCQPLVALLLAKTGVSICATVVVDSLCVVRLRR